MEKNGRKPIDVKSLLNPQSVAVIGASEDQTKFGGRLFKTLLMHPYSGAIYPINLKREQLFDQKAYPDVATLPEAPDMVVMALPRDYIKAQVEVCANKGVKVAIIISSKFSDAGEEGAALERELVEIAHAGGMRLIGPNCLGLISPVHELVLCSSPAVQVPQLLRAPIGFISQSGALMGTLYDRAYGMGIGFSHCVSIGNQADLELNDFVEFLIEDDNTDVICSYVEGIKTPQRFAELARRARKAGKPWLMVKAGSTELGSQAAYSHTASMAGDYAALKAVCARENVVLMDDPLDMLSLARAMIRYPGRKVRDVAVYTTSGGGGAITADRLSDAGVGMAGFSEQTKKALSEYYSEGQGNNPIDIGGRKPDAPDDVGSITATLALADRGVDLGLMVLTTAPDVTGLTSQIADGAARQEVADKPTLYVMLPGRVATGARQVLVERNLPYVDTLAEAMAVLKAWKQWSDYQEADAPERSSDMASVVVEPGVALDEAAAKKLLQTAGIPVNAARVAQEADALCQAADALGYPVVLKVISEHIVHKSDVGGVALGITNGDDLRQALEAMKTSIAKAVPHAVVDGYSVQKQEQGELELIVGARSDPQFGPQVVVGAGGVLVELVKDIAVLPAPVDRASAERAVRGLKIAPLLGTYRGRGELDVQSVVDVVVRLGWLASDLAADGRVQDYEIEVNPLLVRKRGEGVVAVDARAQIVAR